RGPFPQTTEAIGEALLDKYVLPFEIAGVLLTVALIGAVVLVRED
ncbi:MAG TPA: NADH-quinone oxidoreductase subunit J, partial [Dehalococcoidia bacterium]|nr:NADH-quinone oxidoreductase subunit J [Dehalococcoidia bacterium]